MVALVLVGHSPELLRAGNIGFVYHNYKPVLGEKLFHFIEQVSLFIQII